MSYSCPTCGSPNTEKVSVAWQKGARTGDYSTTFSGWARRCRPPEPPRVFDGWTPVVCIIALAMLAPMLVEFVRGRQPEWPYLTDPFVFVLTTVVAVSAIVFVVRFTLMIHHMLFKLEGEHAEWLKRWICRRCGETFTP